ncbi:DUF3303 domain-containing protein [Rheinheimera sediminis]|uniref:DUF3303 domain-containing protein n=1 Tax=Rheinheimera sp. YQF-1 TaxID=2499626 RepID=UPI000FD895F0|nr:DUF3303 family protein [Rheinheimera sp. YQF-1]RVT41473.1 DUF3303 domain-containing protein [Rheinheimera sp. YQF-1]
MKKYMVVENFKPGLMAENYKVYNAKGRQFPEGLYYLNSWVNAEKNICFQLMESNDEALFYQWFKKWEEFVDFELYPLD